MQIFLAIALFGALFGTIGGAVLDGAEGMILGGSSGFVLGTGAWLLSGIITYSLRERRLNRHFPNDDNLF